MLSIDDLVVLGGDSGEKFLFGLRNTDVVIGFLDFREEFVPGLGLHVGRPEIVK